MIATGQKDDDDDASGSIIFSTSHPFIYPSLSTAVIRRNSGFCALLLALDPDSFSEIIYISFSEYIQTAVPFSHARIYFMKFKH